MPEPPALGGRARQRGPHGERVRAPQRAPRGQQRRRRRRRAPTGAKPIAGSGSTTYFDGHCNNFFNLFNSPFLADITYYTNFILSLPAPGA